MKTNFYETLALQNKVANKTITELLRIIRNYYGEKQVDDVLAELRELKDNTYNQNEIREVIESLSNDVGICPECGGNFKYQCDYEFHSELDGNPNDIEKLEYLQCENCGYKDI